jgi:uncharacterized protein (DUF1697 family)
MGTGTYVALLRGINVGGRHIVRMTDLADRFRSEGFTRVKTYIQSGNVVFDSGGRSASLVARVEAMLAEAFDYHASVAIRSRSQMGEIVEHAPDGFGSQPGRFRYDVLYLMPPLNASVAVTLVPARDGVDSVHSGQGVLYYSRLISKAGRSELARLTALPVYKKITIRNWNTTTRLLTMMDE